MLFYPYLLGDLPGFDDNNSIRSKTLEDFVKKAKMLWLISDKELESAKSAADYILHSEIINKVRIF